MNLNQTTEYSIPFRHWELSDCLDESTLKEIVDATIPDGERSYDGTRAADYTGQGIDGRLRVFVDKENSYNFPHLTRLINQLQSNTFSTT